MPEKQYVKYPFTFETYFYKLILIASTVAAGALNPFILPRSHTRSTPKHMPSSNYSLLRGEELLQILAKTTAAVKWLRRGLPTVQIDPAMALLIARAGVYVGKARPGRVYHIREIDNRSIPRDDHYWDDRAVLRYHEDKTSIPIQVKTRQRGANWTDMLTRNPAPQSWQRACSAST